VEKPPWIYVYFFWEATIELRSYYIALFQEPIRRGWGEKFLWKSGVPIKPPLVSTVMIPSAGRYRRARFLREALATMPGSSFFKTS
jgi:hypothetical protein